METQASTSSGRPDFVRQHGLWSDEQVAAARDIERTVDQFDLIRVGYADPHGLLRSKAVSPRAFRSVLRNGLDFSPGPLIFDTGHALIGDIFAEGAGVELAELRGAGDFILVPDPLTFRALPEHGCRTAIVLGDEYLRDGTPHPISGRRVLREVIARAAAGGVQPVIGLEVEWYLLRLVASGDRGTAGGFGIQGAAPAVTTVNGGYQFNSDTLLADLLAPLAPVISALTGSLGLPLRSIEHESGPGQIEITFDPLSALDAADGMVLARSVIKQLCLREGMLASFMALPGLPGVDPSGWHLHQSLARGGDNAFTSSDSGPLSTDGMHYVGGLLRHGYETALLAVPTVNGYQRLDEANTLSPDRLVWSHENRGAMIRVLGGPGDISSHVENRIGEPAANPYLYIGGQIAAGLAGLADRVEPGPPAVDPHADGFGRLPADLGAAITAAAGSTLLRDLLGETYLRVLVELKKSEWERYLKVAGDAVAAREWQDNEYLLMY